LPEITGLVESNKKSKLIPDVGFDLITN
jgi:hypothetical protein